MGWTDKAKSYSSTGGGGRYLKIDDGDRVRVVLTDEPHVRTQYYSKADNAYYAEPGPGRELSRSFPVSVWNVDLGEAQILTMSKGLMSFMGEEADDECDGDTDNQIFEIKRKGTRAKTRWSVKHKGEADAELKALLSDCEIYDVIADDQNGCTRRMDEATDPKRAEKPPAASTPEEDIPF